MAAPPDPPSAMPAVGSSRAEASGGSGSGSSLPLRVRLRRVREGLITTALMSCALLSIAVTVAIIVVLVHESVYTLFGDESGVAFFQQVPIGDFLTGTVWASNFEGEQQAFGVLPLLGGTLLITVIAAAVGLPIGLLSAIYLSEYAAPRTRSVLKPLLEVLAGIPTIVYGFFAVRFLTPYLIKPGAALIGANVGIYNALSGGLVVGIMIIPMVCSLSEDALRSVPRSLREASYALGATKWQVIVKTVVPAAISGIVASFLLAIARAIGETMAVTIAGGSAPNLTINPLDSVQTMTAFIASTGSTDSEAGSMEYKALYAVALTLFLITLVMNIVSHLVTARYREAYQ